jgi:hypothetical protein
MIQLRIWVASVCLSACTAASPPAASPATPPTAEALRAPESSYGVLEIRAARSGSTLASKHLYVRLNGEVLGPLPGRFDHVPVGHYDLQIRDDDQRYVPFSEQIEVEAGKTTQVTPRLSVKRGLLTLRAADDVAGAKVRLKRRDEVRVVSTFPIQINFDATQEPYEVVVDAPDGRHRSFPVDFSDGEALKTLVLTFEPTEL